MKNIILYLFIVITIISCQQTEPINPTINSTNNQNDIPYDSILYNINSGRYHKFDNRYERGVVGKVLLIPNSFTLDTSRIDTIFCYAEFNVEINYDYNQQQLLADKVNDPTLMIEYVDTPTHIAFNSINCFIANGIPNSHLDVFHPLIDNPIVKVEFINETSFMQGLNNVKIGIGCTERSKLQQSNTTINYWYENTKDNLSYLFYNKSFVLSAINVNRKGYFYGTKWSDNL